MWEPKSEKGISEMKLEEKWLQTVSTSHFVKGHLNGFENKIHPPQV